MPFPELPPKLRFTLDQILPGFYNWIQDAKWFWTGLPVNSVYMTTASNNPADLVRYGTWTSLGNLTVGSTTIHVWKRTG